VFRSEDDAVVGTPPTTGRSWMEALKRLLFSWMLRKLCRGPTFKSNDAHGILLLYDDGLHQSSYPFNLLCTPHFIIEFLYFTWSRTYDAQRKRKKYTPRGMPNVKYSSSTLPCGEKKAKGAKNRIIPRAFLSWAVLLVCVRTYVVPTWVHDRLTMRSSAGFKNQHRLENRFESV
jgi:hypothetical protein